MTLPKPKPNGHLKSFTPTAIVLVVEERHCICGKTYTTPNPRLLVKHESGYTRASQKLITHLTNPVWTALPLERHDIPTKCEACPSCFTPLQVNESLFPPPPKPVRDPPRQFLGIDTELSGTEPQKQANSKKKPKYVPRLSDF